MAEKEISRRTFVKGLAAGVASIAALGVLEKVGNTSGATSGTSSGAASLSASMKEELASAASGLTFTPGTYSATARGIDSDVKVTMTFDETMITDVNIDVSGETPDIGGKIGGQMAEAILKKQSADVDVVTTATVTSNAIRTAAADCMSQASGQTVTLGAAPNADSASVDWLGKAPEIPNAQITETLDTDILIVGLGTAGWPALMTAAEAGANVLVIEKNSEPTSVRGDMGAIDTKWQRETAKKFPQTAIDKMEAIEDIVRYGTGYVNFDLVRFWADNSAEAIEWIGDILEDSGKFTIWHEGAVGDTRYPERDKAYATGHSPAKKKQYENDASVTTNSVFLDHLKDLKYDPRHGRYRARPERPALCENQYQKRRHYVRGRLPHEHRHDERAPAHDAENEGAVPYRFPL